MPGLRGYAAVTAASVCNVQPLFIGLMDDDLCRTVQACPGIEVHDHRNGWPALWRGLPKDSRIPASFYLLKYHDHLMISGRPPLCRWTAAKDDSDNVG